MAGPGHDEGTLPPPDVSAPPESPTTPTSTSPPPMTPTSTSTSSDSAPRAAAEQAKTESAEVARTAKEGARDVAGDTAEQAKNVANEARQQVQRVAGQAGDELKARAQEQSERATSGLRTLSGQVSALAEGRTDEAGPLVGYLRDARSKVDDFADRLQSRGPQGVLDDVSDFARRRPGMFLAGTAVLGFVAGRFVRSGAAANGAGGAGADEQPSFPSAGAGYQSSPEYSVGQSSMPPTMSDPALSMPGAAGTAAGGPMTSEERW